MVNQLQIPVEYGRGQVKEKLAGTGFEKVRNATLANVVRARKSAIGDRSGDSQQPVPSPIGDRYPPLKGYLSPGDTETFDDDLGNDTPHLPTPY